MLANESSKERYLSLFKIVTIAVVSVDNLKNIPIVAQYGFALVFFYFVAAITFFLPLAWVTAQLAKRFPITGGSYLWVKEAFGEGIAQLSLWLQWLYNIIWYPTIFAFISTTLASLLFPEWENNKNFILLMSLVLFWLMTFMHCYGLKVSSFISTLGAIIGTLVPMFIMIGLGIYWLASGFPSSTPLTFKNFLPSGNTLGDLSFFSNILFSLLGLEVIAVHASHVKNPQKTYPRALVISGALILFSLVLSSLALCIIVPSEQISLINGLMNLFNLFFSTFDIPYAANAIGWCVVVGGLGIAASWMIGLVKILSVALSTVQVPLFLKKVNKHDAPYPLLIMQAIVYSVLIFIYMLNPNINSSYWILSALTAQFALLYYILLFVSAFRLLKIEKTTSLSYQFFKTVFPVMACLVSAFGIAVGFIPPKLISDTQLVSYVTIMLSGFSGVLILLLIFSYVFKLKQLNQNL